MEKFDSLLKEIVSLIKIYGIDAVYWLIVCAYVVGIIYPQLAHEIISASNIIVLGIIWLGVKLVKDKGFKLNDDKKSFTEEQETRRSAESKVRLAISKLVREAKANRVYVAEYHNGKQNSTNMAFTFLDLTYEDCEGTKYISDEYQNLPTSIYKCSEYLLEKYNFIGTVDELEKIDSKLAHRMMDNNVKYVGLVLLKNSGINIGVLGVSYTNEPELTQNEILTKLSAYAQDISDYLDLRQYKK